MSKNRKTTSTTQYQDSSAKHPEYIAVTRRRDTFISSSWPHASNTKQAPIKMSMAGFYFVGPSDRAKCFYCGIVLRDWDSEDDPFDVHRQWSPRCGYINHITEQQLSTGLSSVHVNNTSSSETMAFRAVDTCTDGDNIGFGVQDSGYVSSDGPNMVRPRVLGASNINIQTSEMQTTSTTTTSTTWEHPAHVQAVLDMGYSLDDVARAERRRGIGRGEFPDAKSLMCAIEGWD